MLFHEAEDSVLNPDVKYLSLGGGTWTSGYEQSLEPDDMGSKFGSITTSCVTLDKLPHCSGLLCSFVKRG